MDYTPVTASAAAADPTLEDWRVLAGALRADFVAASFAAAGELAAAIAADADAADHHPDVALRYPGVVAVGLRSHVTGGITRADVASAVRISAIAAAAGARPVEITAPAVEVCIDAPDAEGNEACPCTWLSPADPPR